MNIFALHRNPKVAAQYHTDKHVVKMILETAQMLSTAHRILDEKSMSEEKSNSIYKKAYPNHPCTIWVRETSANYMWAYQLFEALLEEYEYRYGKTHSSAKLVPYLKFAPTNIPQREITEFAQAMPEPYKESNSVSAYRNYYFQEKSHLFQWTKRDVPEWVSPTSDNFIEEGEANIELSKINS